MKTSLHNLITHTLFILIIVTCLMSCAETPFFEQEVVIPNSSWSYNNKPVYNVMIADTAQHYDLFLEVDHSFDFSYQNLYIKITTGFPKLEDKTEQLSIDLANKKGEWKGDCNNDDCVAKVYLLEGFKFADAGNYTFTVEQFSREENLFGVNSLNLQIFESKVEIIEE